MRGSSKLEQKVAQEVCVWRGETRVARATKTRKLPFQVKISMTRLPRVRKKDATSLQLESISVIKHLLLPYNYN